MTAAPAPERAATGRLCRRAALLLLALWAGAVTGAGQPNSARKGDHRTWDHGGIVRMDSTRKVIYPVFTGHEFANGGKTIAAVLRAHGAKASFFFTGDFYRKPSFAPLIRRLRVEGHYLGAHSDKHLLYASWTKRDSTLVSRTAFLTDLRNNYRAMAKFSITKRSARFFLPAFEWYNESISAWTRQEGLTLVNFTPGTSSNADYTVPSMGKGYVSSDTIIARILRYEASHSQGLNGFLLLMHIGTDPKRKDPLWEELDRLLSALEKRGYTFRKLGGRR